MNVTSLLLRDKHHVDVSAKHLRGPQYVPPQEHPGFETLRCGKYLGNKRQASASIFESLNLDNISVSRRP